MTFEPTQVISRRGTCFWAWSVMQSATNEVWEEGKVYALCWEFESASAFSNCTMRRYGHLSRRPHTLFALLGAAALSRTHCSWRGLHGVEAAFTLCLLHFRARLLALSFSLPSQLLPFWRRDNETASAATALRTINLLAFLSVTPHPSNQEHALQN